MQIPDEIKATVEEHVVNHNITMTEAGRGAQPKVVGTTVNLIIQTFNLEDVCVYWTVIQH